MIDNLTLGTRLKASRLERGFTLKTLESKAGVSATHISEIERGKTSPTIGALQKIASALGRDLTYFLESDALEEVAHQRPYEREWFTTENGAERWMNVSGRIPGSRLSAFRVELEPGSSPSDVQSSEADDLFLVESGSVRFDFKGEHHELGAGDSIHLRGGTEFHFVNSGETEALMFQFAAYRRSMPVAPKN